MEWSTKLCFIRYSKTLCKVNQKLNIFYFLEQLKHENMFRKSACFYHGASDSQSCVNLATKREIKVTINIFIIVLFFTICWLPLNTIKTVKMLCTSCSIPSYFITFGIILTHFNSAVNPFLFAYHLKDFRHAITKLFHLKRRESMSIYWP